MRSSLQKGNVIVFVLIGVALFGALIFSFVKRGQQGQTQLIDQQSTIIAQEIIAYGQTLNRTVNKLISNGCSENQISFQSTPSDGYTNPNAPLDNTCHIFHPAGGGLTDPNFSYGDTLYSGKIAIFNKGCDAATDACTDLVFLLDNISPSLCKSINQLLGVTHDETAIVDTYFTGTLTSHKYTGLFTFSSFIIGDAGTAANILGQDAGCVKHTTNNTYAIFYTLLQR